MRSTTRLMTLAAALAVAAPLAPAGTASAQSTFLPFTQMLRRCDFSETDFNGPTGFGRPQGVLHTNGHDVVADVSIDQARPNTRYDVRLIQMPRLASAPCWGGDPGVAVASLVTDGIGHGQVLVHDTKEPGATGAWVFISLPNPYSQDPAEFYTTDFVAKI
ncbi:hypothetical protein [Mycolicibacterium phlei]|uniref:hypothetical protein n=1 Tax=Mycolicibacterium phlei TaxID=1771 RepID=UPI00025AD2C0|nr:hypothetical protein [Mycolicibacterium phlei]EID14140.1 hypothetical protein MPHLEI_12671 [Mycolicibacterium phlei RIVM601174]